MGLYKEISDRIEFWALMKQSKMNSKNATLIDCEGINWGGSLLLPVWVVFDGKYKYKISVKRDKNVSVNIMEINTENDVKPIDISCYKFESYEVWANGKYYRIEDTLIENTDWLRFINVIAKGEGHARIIFEQISNDNKLSNSINLDEID